MAQPKFVNVAIGIAVVVVIIAIILTIVWKKKGAAGKTYEDMAIAAYVIAGVSALVGAGAWWQHRRAKAQAFRGVPLAGAA